MERRRHHSSRSRPTAAARAMRGLQLALLLLVGCSLYQYQRGARGGLQQYSTAAGLLFSAAALLWGGTYYG